MRLAILLAGAAYAAAMPYVIFGLLVLPLVIAYSTLATSLPKALRG